MLGFALAVVLAACGSDARDDAGVADLPESPPPEPVPTVTGGFIAMWGSEGSGDGQFDSPRGVATDADGNVYVIDNKNHRIQKFDPDGAFLAKWGSKGFGDGEFEFELPGFGGGSSGVATDADGNVYVADSGNNRIQKFSSDSAFERTWGTGVRDGSREFQVCTSDCNDAYGSRDIVNMREPDGTLESPKHVATDADGNVYVADFGNDRIQKFDSDGAFLAMWGAESSGDGKFTSPTGIATDAAGNVYVADTGNNRVQKFGPIGEDGPN